MFLKVLVNMKRVNILDTLITSNHFPTIIDAFIKSSNISVRMPYLFDNQVTKYDCLYYSFHSFMILESFFCIYLNYYISYYLQYFLAYFYYSHYKKRK